VTEVLLEGFLRIEGAITIFATSGHDDVLVYQKCV